MTQPAPTGEFTFTVVVTNTGNVPLTITELNDDIYGDLFDAANPNIDNNTCDDLEGDTLAPGANTAPCSFTAEFTGDPGDTQTDTVTVTGVDGTGTEVTDDDPATVALVGTPEIMVVKTADPPQRPEPGGTFTFTVVVTNTGDVPLTITELTDDIYGDLGDPANPNITNNTCDDLIGDTLAPGASTAPCTFDGEFTGDGGDSQTDTVTVIGEDETGTDVTDDDDAVVTLTVVQATPSISVRQDRQPGVRPSREETSPSR